MFDTHCHLNFKAFRKNLNDVYQRAINAGVDSIIVPGTDVETSKKAVDIAGQYKGVFGAVGIHPHHAEEVRRKKLELRMVIKEIEELLKNDKVVAVGEVGMDLYEYANSKYGIHQIDEESIQLQEQMVRMQIQLAVTYHKGLILHNRLAKKQLLSVLEEEWDESLRGRAVFHCCEPDKDLLIYAEKYGLFIGVDGDVTFIKEKQDFIRKVPLDMLVLETDSPYLLPEPLRTQKKYPNEPKNIPLIAEYIAILKGVETHEVLTQTTKNAKLCFFLSK